MCFGRGRTALAAEAGTLNGSTLRMALSTPRVWLQHVAAPSAALTVESTEIWCQQCSFESGQWPREGVLQARQAIKEVQAPNACS